MSSEAETFLGIEQPPVAESKQASEVSPSSRMATLVFTWGVALMAAFPSPAGIVYLPAFPVGLTIIFPLLGKILKSEGAVMGGGWFVYLALSITLMASGTKARFFRYYAILLILLCCNVIGCQSAWRDLSGIN